MAQASGEVSAFSSLDARQERQEEAANAGLEKVFYFQGVSELFSSMKTLYGRTAAWSSLMKCEVIYIKDRKTAVGVNGTRYGLFFAETPTNPTWSPDIGTNMMTLGEKACMDAQKAKHERLQASLKTTSSLVHQVMEKSRLARERLEELEKAEKKMEAMQKSSEELMRELQRKHKDMIGNMMGRYYDLKQDRDAWMRRCASLDEENLRLKQKLHGSKSNCFNRTFKILEWMALCLLVFGLLQSIEAKTNVSVKGYAFTPERAEGMTPSEMVKHAQTARVVKQRQTCEVPKIGCLAKTFFFKKDRYTFFDLMTKCNNKQGIIDISAFSYHQVVYECEREFGEEWCKDKVERLVPNLCNQTDFFKDVKEQLVTLVEKSGMVYSWVEKYHIESWVTGIFSLVIAGKKDKILKTLPFIFLAWWLRLPAFILCTAASGFPTILLPFLAFQLIQPSYIIFTGFFMWILQILVAVFWNEGPSILMEISYGLVYTFAFFVWSMAVTVSAGLQLTLTLQIVIFCALITVVCGTKYACSTITITNPDGTINKCSRVSKLKTAVVNQCKKTAKILQARGIIPSTPVKVNSIVTIEGKNGKGTGWRFMNYIATAGHVVAGSEWATIKYNDIAVKVKKEREIEIFECVDTIVVFKLPKELQMVKPLKIASNLQSNYMALHGFCANFINPVTFFGWCIVDGRWINNTFNTFFGNSGAPYCDADGKLVGMHLGTQGVTSQGVVVADILKQAFDPAFQQCAQCDREAYQLETTPFPAWFNFDRFMTKVIDGTKWSHQAILKQQEEMMEKILLLEKELKETRGVLSEEKKKGKTKKTARGGKATITKKYLTKGHFMKMRMLAEEEYKRLMDEGFTSDEIKEVVNNLREQAWLEYCMDNEIDDEGAEEWYDDMVADTMRNEQIDREIEAQMEEEGYFAQKKALKTLANQAQQRVRKTFCDQALLHIIEIREDKVRTVKIETQEESATHLKDLFDKMVKKDTEVEVGTSKALLSNGDEIEYLENKKIDWEKLKMVHLENEKKFEKIERSGTTEISTGENNQKNIMREKVTNIQPPIDKPEEEKKAPALEQRKKICKTCGSEKPHNYAACRRRHEKCFCVFCGEMHSEHQGHTRKIECPRCKQGFNGVEALEKHALSGCQKN
nr:non-structural polyprotein [Duck astrovirus CPH]WPX56597.1 non-structural polyprotein [Duck astrovirus CPH]